MIQMCLPDLLARILTMIILQRQTITAPITPSTITISLTQRTLKLIKLNQINCMAYPRIKDEDDMTIDHYSLLYSYGMDPDIQ